MQSSSESLWVTQDIRLTSGNLDETQRTKDSQMFSHKRQITKNYSELICLHLCTITTIKTYFYNIGFLLCKEPHI